MPSYPGHVIWCSPGLIVTAMATQAGNAAERLAALEMVKRLKRRGLHHAGCGQELSGRGLREWAAQGRSDTPRGRVQAEPEVAQLADRGRTQRSRTAAISQKKRKLVEKSFGWMKPHRLQQVKLGGTGRVDWLFPLALYQGTICCV